jgi:uncharacterized repeat protein (TIGR03837 family)
MGNGLKASSLPRPVLAWDIFCTVVDHYGDIGVSWRLARQLASEYRQRVRLWVDDLDSLHRLRPEIDPIQDRQTVDGVEVRRWAASFPQATPGDIVVEAFGCSLPENFLAAMALRGPRPLWINLEYLSAEDWVEGCHGLPSPQPRTGLEKYFFFPGFGDGTGGLPREQSLFADRDAFQSDAGAQSRFWERWGLGSGHPDATRASLFCYDHAPVIPLLEALSRSDTATLCLIPEDYAARHAARWMGWQNAVPGQHGIRGKLEVHVLPFLSQDDYDRLLWACDFNFVRGEDSFLRAQWAARPFAWQIYPQQDGAHWNKLEAFLARYQKGLPPEAAGELRIFWTAWNRGGEVAPHWDALRHHLTTLSDHAKTWCRTLSEVPDLAAKLMAFCGTHRV